MVLPDKSRRYLALDRSQWRRLDELAELGGRRPGEQLGVILARYFAALDAGTAVAPDPVDVTSRRRLRR